MCVSSPYAFYLCKYILESNNDELCVNTQCLCNPSLGKIFSCTFDAQLPNNCSKYLSSWLFLLLHLNDSVQKQTSQKNMKGSFYLQYTQHQQFKNMLDSCMVCHISFLIVLQRIQASTYGAVPLHTCKHSVRLRVCFALLYLDSSSQNQVS